MLVSGENYEEGIMVDMSSLPNGEGATVANVCYEGILQCRCGDCVKILIFDTTNSNSGIHKVYTYIFYNFYS